MNIKTLLLAALGIGLIAVVTLKLVSTQKPNSNEMTSSDTASLQFSPSTIKLAKGEKTTVNVVLNSGNHSVAAVTVALNFDATKVKVNKMTNGTLFPNVLSSAKISSGTAAISIATPPDVQGQTTSGNILVLELEGISATSSTLTFGSDSMAVALDQTGNILSNNGQLSLN